MTSLIDRIYSKHFLAGVQSVWLVVPGIQTVSSLLPGGRQINVSSSAVTNPVTGIELELAQLSEG